MSDWTANYSDNDWMDYFDDNEPSWQSDYSPEIGQSDPAYEPSAYVPTPDASYYSEPWRSYETTTSAPMSMFYAPPESQDTSPPAIYGSTYMSNEGYPSSVPSREYEPAARVTDTSSPRELGAFIVNNSLPAPSSPGYGPPEERGIFDIIGDKTKPVTDFLSKNKWAGDLLAGGLAGGLKYMENKRLAKDRAAMEANVAAREAPIAAKRARYEAPLDVGAYTTGMRQRVAVDPATRNYRQQADRSQLYFTPPSRSFGQSFAAEQARPMAKGGSVGGLGQASRAVPGKDGGQSDKVKALLSPGEYVMDADTVSSLGDGNTASGAAKLDQMRESLRAHKRSAPSGKIPPQAKKPTQYMKGGK